MRWHRVLAVGGAAAGVLAGVGPLAVPGVASAQTAVTMHVAASPWGKPIEVPGLGALNKGDDASVNSISCVAPGECAATGNFAPRPLAEGSFVVSETSGHWGKAKVIAIPGRAPLFESSIACGSLGNCALGGDGGGGAFVASEVNGKWGKAIRVPGLAALDKGKGEALTSVSCSRGGNDCSAGGWYVTDSNGSRNIKPFVVSERNGRWGKALTVPGLGQGPTRNAKIRTLDCASAGNCSAGGDGPGNDAFVVGEKNGRWGRLIEVPGTGALNAGGEAETDHISCATAGNCGAGGTYQDSQGEVHAFVASEKNGTWGNAIEVPGTAALDTNEFIDLEAISCTTPGDCTASGTYKDTAPSFQGWVATEKNGTWASAIAIPGLGALNKGDNVGIARVECASAGNCVANGNYQVTKGEDGKFIAFVASETKGVWARATPLPGLSKLSTLSTSVHVVSCPSSGHCSAGGSYQDVNGRPEFGQAFVVNQK
jgi:hypothetical protein